MLSWRSWASPSTSPRYYWCGGLPSAPLRLRRAPVRHARLPLEPERAVAAGVLPGARLELPHRPRHRPEERQRPHHHDLHRARGHQYLCLRRFPRRRGDRPRGHRRHVGGAEDAKSVGAAARPLHHLRVRSCRPARRRGVPRGERAVRRPRLQRGREGSRRRGGRPLHRGRWDERRRSPRGRPGAGARARRRLGRRRGQPLHHALGPGGEAGHPDRGAGVERGREQEAPARRRGPRRPAVHGGGASDGEPRPQAAGDGVHRRGNDCGGRRPALRGDRGHGGLRPGRQRSDRGRHRRGAAAARGPVRPTGSRCPLRAHFEMSSNAVERLAEELAEVAGTEVELERPSDPGHGDYATNVALRTAPVRKRSPREVAEELAGSAARLEAVERAEVAGPGFLNLWLTRGWYERALAEMLEGGERYGAGEPAERERILVELVSPNPTGPLVVGSARNGAYGDSIARLLELSGREVVRECYLNDVGRQIELFRESVEARRRGEEPPEGGYMGDYVAQIAELSGDPVEEMIGLIERELEEFRIHIDVWVRQSGLEAEVSDALESLPTYEQDGARWVQTTAHGDDKDRVVVRSDGSCTYLASDAAYMRNKFERGFDRVVYVLAADHHGYVARLKALADGFGYGGDRVEVPIYQLVNIVEGGEAKKGSKRRGDVVFLRELIDAIGVDAARWYLISRGPDQPIDIDVDLAAERSQKNPVYYVQYVHARIAGILRNAAGASVGGPAPGDLAVEERDLIKRLAEFPGVAAEATERRAPHAIPLYAIRVADDFHRFYHEHRVLESDAEAFRLGLCRATQTVIARCLDLIGVEAPERM